ASMFDTIDVGDNANPLFVDIDNDGDDDLFIGNAEGSLFFYENVSGQFAFRTTTYGNIQPMKESAPSFADIDLDGDLDLFVGTFKGGVHFYRNEKPVSVNLPNPQSQIPNHCVLYQNYPNPFNPITHFRFSISNFGLVSLTIYNVLGVEVAALLHENKTPGEYTIQWDATGLPSGIYVAKLTAGLYQDRKRIVLIK
ncbi:MAG: T9SS type A sorting domain-containing protein, partial [Bacteroidetes bacterium]